MNEENIQEMLPLSEPAYLILGVLINKEQHGYGIIKTVEKNKNEMGYHLLTGTLYKNIDRMLKKGLIKKVPPPSNTKSEDSRRIYYIATGLGERVFNAQALRYSNLAMRGGYSLA